MAALKFQLHKSQLVYMIITKFQRIYPCFQGRATGLDYSGSSLACALEGNQRWRPVTGRRKDITNISACAHVSNEILTAIPMFSGQGRRHGGGGGGRGDLGLIEKCG